jgi:ribosome recycling factor
VRPHVNSRSAEEARVAVRLIRGAVRDGLNARELDPDESSEAATRDVG